MKVTESIQAIDIPFKIPVSPDIQMDRRVFAYVILSEKIILIDSGVAGAESIIFNCIEDNGRDIHDIVTLVISHAHPDHIGAAKTIRNTTNCKVLCHPYEKKWIENVEKQAKERPVPGFDRLVAGSVPVHGTIQDGDILNMGDGLACEVIHTPGHSAGSVSLFFKEGNILFSGDALPMPGDLPIYDDITASFASIEKLKSLGSIHILLSSWEAPILGENQIKERIGSALAYLSEIHATVLSAHKKTGLTGMPLCLQVVANLGLPPFAANPLLEKAFMSSLKADNGLIQ